MANVILDQFVHLKQPTCDYLSQGHQISAHLADLKEAIVELVFAMNAFLTSSQQRLSKYLIPVDNLEALHLCQIRGIEILRAAADHIESYKGFEIYSVALIQMEVAHV